MKRLIPALFGLLPLTFAIPAHAEDAPAANSQGCGLVSGVLISQGQGQVTINCVGVTEEAGIQLAGVLTYILQHRLDPEIVVAKLNEVEGAPEGNVARTLTTEQGQAIVQHLVGKPTEKLAVVADPAAADSGDYALAIATKLQLAGWQIEGNQIKRVARKGFDDLPGVVLAVRNEKAPPEKAKRLKAALASARIFLPIMSDPTLPDEGALLWVGKRPSPGASPTQ